MSLTVRRVLVLMDTTRTYFREIIRGIARYHHEHGEWLLEYSPYGPEDFVPKDFRDYRADGMLVRINQPQLLEAVLRTGIPAIDLLRVFPHSAIPCIGPDEREVTRQLLHHFQEQHFHSFAFLGIRTPETHFLAIRHETFVEEMRKKAFPSSVYRIPTSTVYSDRLRISERIRGSLRKWLQKLPRRTAVLCGNDELAFQVLEQCRLAGIAVPQHLAVAGIGNDDCICELGHPTLTSVELRPQKIGYQAAELLQQAMDGRSIPHDTLTPCGEIIVRQSTDTFLTEDESLNRAIQFIRHHACEGIGVEDVCQAAHLTRIPLENRFKKWLGRTVYQEIQRIRLAEIQKMLRTTRLPFKTIVRQAGFRRLEQMMRFFRKETGMTMKEFRDEL
ncbi:MAG: DNA-binding transcriptional regulator [Planctomycetia bacterium]|nr:DNA-binding transcriptional regulator [Planctomycetia bacterium]